MLEALETIEHRTTQTSAEIIGGALAEAWVQGEMAYVRDTINAAPSRETCIEWKNSTRSMLPTELMKDAFDAYMRG